jgi:hypothetical protein
MQTKELIGPGGLYGHPKYYGVIHYLDDSFLMIIPSLWKELHHKTISYLFSRVVDIRGHKDYMCATNKTPNKILCMVSREYIKFPTSTKYQNTQKESSWDLNKCSKQQNTESVNKNSSSLANFLPPLKYVTNFHYIFSGRGWKISI